MMKIPSKQKKRTGRPPKGYDSFFEYDLHCKRLKGCKCHSETIKYVQHKTYHPDFIYHMGKDTIYIEAKGRFRDRQEARKYVDIAEGLGRHDELVFVFYNPKTPMPGARRRKDGTKFTHGEWAEKQGFRYFSEHDVHVAWSYK